MSNSNQPSRLSVWMPPPPLSKRESVIAKRLSRTGRFYLFLREHRHELMDEAFQRELLAMYSQKKEGAPPVSPAILALVTLLQAYDKTSDAKAVEQVMLDLRWQLVLDCVGREEPLFSQGVLVDFRKRLIAANMDRRLLERTVELARGSGDFGAKMLRVALDSAPLWGAGRVEDTFNLIEHAMRVVVRCAAVAATLPEAAVRDEARLELVGKSSVKAALDIDWDNPAARHDALQKLIEDVRRLRAWIDEHLAAAKETPGLKEALALLAQVVEQDLEPDPSPKGGQRIKRGVARDRRISVSDADMRHGRKSKSRLFNGYKRHIARDLDGGVILAVTARPANEPEALAADALREDLAAFGALDELHVDRGYLASPVIVAHHAAGGKVVAKPWSAANGDRFAKNAFAIDLARGRVRCPAGHEAAIRGDKASWGARCAACPQRSACTDSARGRTIAIHAQEAFLVELRNAKATPQGRAELRERVGVEHSLAHLTRRQGPRARYRGVRKNVFDLRRTAAVENLITADRLAS